MKFSILLPTKNRLELLKYAVQSVLEQDYPNWEIVISDNASDDDIAGFVATLADSRIKYSRSEKPLPVTENWNRALDFSSGDYIIMLGDDDCLMGRCLSIAKALLESHQRPDLLYTKTAQFAYPNVMPTFPRGFVEYGYSEFLGEKTEPFFLTRKSAIACVEKALSFQVVYGFNMQHSIFSREMVVRLARKGPFFQSPYPDYYATNVLMLTTERILVCPWPLIGIGISPKSFGFFYFNRREGEGVNFLQLAGDPEMVSSLKPVILPGSNMNTSWLLAMETLKRNFPDEIPADVRYDRYRFLQFGEMLRTAPSRGEFLKELKKFGTKGERVFWRCVSAMSAVGSWILPAKIWKLVLRGSLSLWHRSHPRFRARNIGRVIFADIVSLARGGSPTFGAQRRLVDYADILEMSREESRLRKIPEAWISRR